MTPLRVVFDTNVFSVENFDLLADSPLKELVNCGRVFPIYGDVFLEEMLQAHLSDRKRPELLNRWLPYIVATAPRLCDELPAIWHRELVQGKGMKANIFMPRRDQENVLAELGKLPFSGGGDLVDATLLQRTNALEKKLAARELSKQMRAEVARSMKSFQLNVNTTRVRTDNGKSRELLVEKIGRLVIERYIDKRKHSATTNRWLQARDAYPYFTQFVENKVYKELLFMTQHSTPIDINAEADLDIMTHLLKADALVSNETGFLRIAFEDIWRLRRKILFTSKDFVQFLRRLA